MLRKLEQPDSGDTVGDKESKSEIETNSSFVSENKQSKSHSLGGVND